MHCEAGLPKSIEGVKKPQCMGRNSDFLKQESQKSLVINIFQSHWEVGLAIVRILSWLLLVVVMVLLFSQPLWDVDEAAPLSFDG